MHGAAGEFELFQGEITSDVTHATIEEGFAYYDVTCAGTWWKADQRGDFCRIYSDDVYDQWFTLENLPKQFEVDTDGKIMIGVSTETPVKANSHGYLYYWLSDGMGDPSETITGICGNLFNDIQTSAGTFVARLQSSEDWTTWYTEQTWTDTYCASAVPWYRAITQCAAKIIRFDLYSTARWANLDEDVTMRLKKIGLCTNHTRVVNITAVGTGTTALITSAGHDLKTGDRIFINGTTTTNAIDGWRTITYVSSSQFRVDVSVSSVSDGTGIFLAAPRVDEAMANIAVTTGLAPYADLQTGGIGNINWGLNVRPHCSRAEAIEMLAANNVEPIDYGFWEGDIFYCKERPTTPPAYNDYMIDTNAPGIDFSVFANTEDSPKYVKVLYKFRDTDWGTSPIPDGTLQAVYLPGVPNWDDASIVLDVWDQWADMSLEEGQANAIGTQILAWLDYNKYVGTITISSPTVPIRTGGTKNTAYIRAGDYIQDEMATIARSMITSMKMDVDTGVATLGIGETKAEFVARITPREKRHTGKIRIGRLTLGPNRWRFL